VDIVLDEIMMEYLCGCEECSQIFKKLKRHFECLANINPDEEMIANNLEGRVN